MEASVIYKGKLNQVAKAACEKKWKEAVYYKLPEKKEDQIRLYNHLTNHWIDMVFIGFSDMYNIAIDASREASELQYELVSGAPDISHVWVCNEHGKISYPQQ